MTNPFSWFSWRLSASAFAPFPCSRPPRPSPALYARAVFAAFGLTIALASAVGESRHFEALKSHELSSILLGNIRAEAVWPLPARIREANAVLHAAMQGVPPLLALAELRRALIYAPNDPILHFWLAYHRIRIGDLAGARETLAKLRSLGPGWPQTKLVERWLDAAERKEKTP